MRRGIDFLTIKKTRLLLFFFTLIFHQIVNAQIHIAIPSSSPIQSFDKSDYHAQNQNWDISQSEEGLVYVANAAGLLEYDGEHWQLYKSKHTLRAVLPVENRIYVGGMTTMGYYTREGHQLKFHDLTKLIDFKGEIWKILIYKEQIVFQTFSAFYIYDGKQKITQSIITDRNITYAYNHQDKLVYQNIKSAFNIYEDLGKVTQIKHPLLSKIQVQFIHPLEKGKFLIASLKNGLFLIDGQQVKPISSNISAYLKKTYVNKGMYLADLDIFVFGTMHAGLVFTKLFTDKVQEDYYEINTQQGLSDNRIHSLHYQDKLLWVGTDKGISLLNVEDKVTHFYDPFDQLGSIYDIAFYKGYYYIGTNKGVYYTQDLLSKKTHKFHLIPNSEEQIWRLEVIDDQLICGHNKGSSLIENQKFKTLSDKFGIYTIQKMKTHPEYLIQVGYNGLAICKKNAEGKWFFSHLIKDFPFHCRDLVQQEDGSFLVSGFGDFLYKINLSTDLERIQTIENIGNSTALANAYNIRIYPFEGQTIISTSEGSYLYTDTQLQILPDPLAKASYISEKIGANYLIYDQEKLQLYDTQTNTIKPLSSSLLDISKDLVYKYENISVLHDSVAFFAFNSGAISVDEQCLEKKKQVSKAPHIRSFSAHNIRTAQVFKGDLTKAQIPFLYNTIRFQFAMLNYTEKVNYEYLLENYHTDWQNNQEENSIEFQNLPSGKYTFRLRQKGSTIEKRQVFKILKPWYTSWYAYVVYLCGILLLFYALYQLHIFNLKKEKLALLLKKRHALKAQFEANQKEMIEVKANKLQEEVLSKNNELSTLLYQISKKTELLQSIKIELQGLQNLDRYQHHKKLDKMSTMLDSIDDNQDWLLFENTFRSSNQYFFSCLREKHPSLTPEDLKLCAYLKVKLSTKEIAPIFNITPKSLELKRYRLRKKLGLQQSENLVNYIDQF